jgi:hypothetical protein
MRYRPLASRIVMAIDHVPNASLGIRVASKESRCSSAFSCLGRSGIATPRERSTASARRAALRAADATSFASAIAAIAAALGTPSHASTSAAAASPARSMNAFAGLAVAAGLVAIITMSVVRTTPTTQIAAADSSELVLPVNSEVVRVSAVAATFAEPFTYIDGNAKSVAVVGSFNDWDSTKTVLSKSADGVWSTTVMLAPGRYEYQLVVDGKWIADPSAQQSASSEFGAANSVLIVAPR